MGMSRTETKRGPIISSLVIGAFVAILNETLLTIAFNDLMKEFSLEPSSVQWLSTAYMLVIGILVPVTALLCQWFTTRQMFLSAMILFLAGTLICGFAPTFSILLVGRIIQALGTGLLLPVLMNTILAIYPPEKRGGAMGLIGLVIMFAPALGPTLSGIIIDTFTWRWLFFLVVPLVVFSIIFASVYLKNVSELTKPKVDFLSIILSTLGFGGVVYGFSTAGEGEGWGNPVVIYSLIVGLVGLLFFILRQLRLKEPMLDIRAFRYRMFSVAAAMLTIMMMTLFSTLILLPMYLQEALLLTSVAAGLVLLPGGLINGLLSPVAGVLFDKFGPKTLVTPGLVLVILSLGLFSQLSASTSVAYVVTLHVMMLIGISMVMMPAQTTGLNQLPKQLYPHGTAIMNTLQQVSGAIGTALFVSIMSSGKESYLKGVNEPNAALAQVNGLISGLQQAFFIAALVGAIALVLSFFLKRTQAPENSSTGVPIK